MKIILNSGVILNNIRPIDSTKNPTGLIGWSMKQSQDQLISFKDISIRASQIAAIQDDEGEFSQSSYHQQTDINNQMPWNNN